MLRWSLQVELHPQHCRQSHHMNRFSGKHYTIHQSPCFMLQLTATGMKNHPACHAGNAQVPLTTP